MKHKHTEINYVYAFETSSGGKRNKMSFQMLIS